MTNWQTDPQTGLRVGVALIAAVFLLDGSLITWAATRPVTLWTFLIGLVVLVSLVIIGVVIYHLNNLLRSDYILDRNAFTIVWGANGQIVPTPQIERVILGENLEGRIRSRGFHWPGHWVGYGEVEGTGPTLFYATVPPKQQIFLVTSGLAYGISPEDREGFLHTLQTRMQMGPTQLVEPSSHGPAFLQWEFWQDWLALALLAGALTILLSQLAFLSARYASLPRLLPLHFDASGEPNRLGPQGEIFFLPLIGSVIFLVNGGLGSLLYRRERLASYLLWGGTVAVQILLWAAILGILAAL